MQIRRHGRVDAPVCDELRHALLQHRQRDRAEREDGVVEAPLANRGATVFNDAGCSGCHIPPTYTDVLTGPAPPFRHLPSAVGTETVYATRSATKMYRTTPLRALWQHPPYFHDGSAATLLDVVNHYERVFGFVLTAQQKSDLVEFLKSL